VRRILTAVIAGALIGIVLATWLGPRVLTWWFTPPAGVMLTNASEAVRWGMDRLVHAQLISLLVGAILGLVVGILLRPKGATPPPRHATSTPAASPPRTTT
jgi:F0F1-type ATP synthase assembly protein I